MLRAVIDKEVFEEAKRLAQKEQVYFQRWIGIAIEERVRRLTNEDEEVGG